MSILGSAISVMSHAMSSHSIAIGLLAMAEAKIGMPITDLILYSIAGGRTQVVESVPYTPTISIAAAKTPGATTATMRGGARTMATFRDGPVPSSAIKCH